MYSSKNNQFITPIVCHLSDFTKPNLTLPKVCLQMMVDSETVERRRVWQNVWESVLDVATGSNLLWYGDQRSQVGNVRRRHLELVLATRSG